MSWRDEAPTGAVQRLVAAPALLWLRWVFGASTGVTPAVVVPAVGPVVLTGSVVGPVKASLTQYLGASLSTRLLTCRAVSHDVPSVDDAGLDGSGSVLSAAYHSVRRSSTGLIPLRENFYL